MSAACIGVLMPGMAAAAGPPLSAGPSSSLSASSSLFYPQAMTSADFSGDGNPDLAATNYESGTVTVLLGDGQGHFTPAPGSPIQLASGVSPIAAATFGNDTQTDLAVGNQSSGTVTILIGAGDGSFIADPTTLSLDCSPSAIATGDFNGDLVTDIAVAESCGEVQVFLGQSSSVAGSPTFDPPTTISLPSVGDCTARPSAIVAAPLSPSISATRIDLAVADGTNDRVDVLLNDGTGSFTVASYATGEANGCAGGFSTTNLESMTLGDFSGDGSADDLAVGFGDGMASILLDDGSGAYTLASGSPARIAPDYTQVASLATGSFSSTGRDGIVAGDYWQGGCACITYDADWVSVDQTTGAGQLTPVTGSPFELDGVAGPVLAGSFAGGLGIPGATDDVVATDVGSCHGNAVVTLIGQGPAGGPPPRSTVFPGDGCAIPPPSAATGPAQGVSLTGATVTGTAAAGYGSPITGCEFQYGAQGSFSSTAPCSPEPADGGQPSVSAALSGLTTSKTYQYRLVVTGAGGTATGLTQTFQTCTTPEVDFGDSSKASGCFIAGPNGTYTSTGAVDVNGIDFVPSSGGVTLNPDAQTLTSASAGQIKIGSFLSLPWPGQLRLDLSGTFTLSKSIDVTFGGFRLDGELTAQLLPDAEAMLDGEAAIDLGGAPVQASLGITTSAAEGLAAADLGIGPADASPLDPHTLMFCSPKARTQPKGFTCDQVPTTDGKSFTWRLTPTGEDASELDPHLMPFCKPSEPAPIGYRCKTVTNRSGKGTSNRLIAESPGVIRLGGVLGIEGLGLSYDRDQATWAGEATLALGDVLPGSGVFGSAAGDVTLTLNASFSTNPLQFDQGGFALDGLTIPLGPAQLNEIDFELTLHPHFGISGDAALVAGPEQTVAIDGGFDLQEGDQSGFDLKLHGDVQVKTIGIGGYVEYDGIDGERKVLLGGSFTRSWGPVSATLGVGGGIEVNPFHFQLTGDGTIGAFGANVDAHGVVSDAGVGACGHVSAFVFSGDVGFKHYWSGETDFDGCDFSGLYTVGQAGASSLGTGRTIRIPRRQSRIEIAAVGAAGPPALILSGPRGERLRTPATANRIQFTRAGLALAVSDSRTTYFVVRRPAAGRWHVAPAPGAPSPVRYEIAQPLRPLGLRAHVSGHGRTRTLSWHLNPQRGQTVRFIQEGATATTIAATTHGAGRARFRVAAGPGGRRTVLAVRSIDGFPRSTQTVARFNVSRPMRPRVSDAHYRLRGSQLLVSWHRARHIARWYLAVGVARRPGLQYQLPGSAGSQAVLLAPGAKLRRVTITAVSADGMLGRPTTATKRRARRSGHHKHHQPVRHRHTSRR